MPMALDRQTGKEKFFAAPSGKRSGTWALLDNDHLITGVDASGPPHKVSFDAAKGRRNGDAFGWFPGIDMAVTKSHAYVVTHMGIN